MNLLPICWSTIRVGAGHGPNNYTREGWPLLTVETEVTGESSNERGPYWLGWFVGPVVPVQEIFVLPWLL